VLIAGSVTPNREAIIRFVLNRRLPLLFALTALLALPLLAAARPDPAQP
jgi:hypothetical protein